MTGEWEEPQETGKYLTIFPNPAGERIHVRLNMDDGRFHKDLRLEIYDIFGRKSNAMMISSSQPQGGREGDWTIDVSIFPPGIYLVRLSVGEIIVAGSKFVVVRHH